MLAGNPEDLYPDGRYNHILQVQERLNFLRFLLKGTTILFYINLTEFFFQFRKRKLENLISRNYFLDGQLWLCAPQAKQIWTCLAENAVFTQDREACFKWFSKLMGDEPDLGKNNNLSV